MRAFLGTVILAACAAPAPPPATVPGPRPREASRLHVIVAADVELYATAAKARGTQLESDGDPMALQLVAYHGDVVEVRTGEVVDCVPGFAPPYALTVFVGRDQLWLRARQSTWMAYPDGSAVAVDRGAPLVDDGETLDWYDSHLAATPFAPPAGLGTFATPPLDAPTALPATTLGEDEVVDDEVPCGRIRFTREAFDAREQFGFGRSGFGGTPNEVVMWRPVPGPVTWVDGSPAGDYTGTEEKYANGIAVGDRVCVAVPGIAERVCHPYATSDRVVASESEAADGIR